MSLFQNPQLYNCWSWWWHYWHEKQIDDAYDVSAASDMDDIYGIFYMSREDQKWRGYVLPARAVPEGRHAPLATCCQSAFESRHLSLARYRYSVWMWPFHKSFCCEPAGGVSAGSQWMRLWNINCCKYRVWISPDTSMIKLKLQQLGRRCIMC